MTDDLAGQIRRNLWAIHDLYDETLVPAKHTTGNQGKSSFDHPMPIGAHIVEARREVHQDLAYWAWFILDSILDIDGGHMASPFKLSMTPPHPSELVKFIVIWVDKIVTGFPDDADNLAAEAEDHAKTLLNIVAPPRRDWVDIGPCPRTFDTEHGTITCATTLRAYPGRDTIQCEGCLHEDTVDWWRTQILGHRPQHVPAGELTNYLTIDLQMTVDPSTVRAWFARGKIQRIHGPHLPGDPWLYDWAQVMVKLQKLGRKVA